MKKIITITFTLVITSAISTVTIQPSKFCQCTDLILQSDCTAFGQRCLWNNSKCTANSCISINLQNQCAATTKCQWNISTITCENFTSCSDLKATTNSGCLKLSNQCEGSLNGVCQSAIPTVCSSYTSKSDCTVGSDGQCFWNGTTCSLWSACNQAKTSTECQGAPLACAWNNSACISSVCSDFQTADNCSFTQSTLNQDIYSLCIWSSSNNKCNSGDSSQLISSDCLYHTSGYFRWNSNSATSGSCQQCSLQSQDFIIEVIIAGLIVLLA